MTYSVSSSRSANVSGEAEAGFQSGVAAKAKVGGEAKALRTHATEIKQSVKLMMSIHSFTSGRHAWEIKPADGSVLEGKPWDAVKEPRFRLIDKRNCREAPPSAVIVEVRCRREDLHIQDIELKEGDNRLFPRKSNNRAAVDGYIRSQFEKAGLDLDIGSIDEKFFRMILAREPAERNND